MDISTLKNELLTQDNCSTIYPMFCIHQKTQRESADGAHVEYYDPFSCSNYHEDGLREIFRDQLDDDEGDIENMSIDEIIERFELRKYTYDLVDTPVPGQCYLTRKGAEEHIRLNHYHYYKPFVFVDSAWRNPEWQFMRELIMQAGAS